MTNNPSPTKRIEYIDAMRGFTMCLVVFHHIAQFCWDLEGPSFHQFFFQVRMPMFFFISGFVLYKAGVEWNVQHIIRFLKKKIPVQLLSPFAFFAVYLFVQHKPLIESITDSSKAGYWFTYVLFIYYVIYCIVRLCFRKYSYYILFLLGIVFIPFAWPPIVEMIPLPSWLKGSISMNHWIFFLYFVIGNFTHRYFDHAQKWLDSKWLLPGCIVTYFFLNIIRSLITSPAVDFMIGRIITLAGLVLLFSFFRQKRDIFSKDKVLGHTLQYIGRRTLDIYLIHYFLLPSNLKDVVTIFNTHPMPVIEAGCTFVVGSIVIAFCLLIGNIIRLSPVMAHWVFGAKKQY